MKLRRTNNTAADITGGTRTYDTDILTTNTSTFVQAVMTADYTTTNTNDSVTIFGSVGTVPGAGSLDVTSCSIRAARLQQ